MARASTMVFLVALFLTLGCGTTLAQQLDLSSFEIPDMDDIPAIQERCDARSGNGTYEILKAELGKLPACIQKHLNVEKLKVEVNEAKKTGSMDEVFGKYCNRRDQFKKCTLSAIEAASNCMEDEERNALNVTLEIVRQLGEFVCFKSGDRIAMFVAEGGVDCITSQLDPIKTCINTSISDRPNANGTLPLFLIDQKRCGELDTLRHCIVKALEQCKDSTPANLVDSLLRFVTKNACIQKHRKRSISPGFRAQTLFHFFQDRQMNND